MAFSSVPVLAFEREEDLDNNAHFTLYPAGGGFNELRSRKEYRFLEDLLNTSLLGYVRAVNKREFVVTNILDKIPGGLKLWKGTPKDGYMVRLSEDDAYDKISQNLRDRKKKWMRKYNPIVVPPARSSKRGKSVGDGPRNVFAVVSSAFS